VKISTCASSNPRRRVQERAGIDLRKDKLALQRLKEAAEKAKIELSSAQTDDQPAVHHGGCSPARSTSR
jgi:hypothetical protein